MARYRGKHEGKTRGKYVEAQLRHVFDDPIDWSKACMEIGCRLGAKGSWMVDSGKYHNESFRTNEYVTTVHLAGATVGIKGVSYHEKPESSWIYQHTIDIKIVSNDSLEDVIEKIKECLPYSLEDIDPSINSLL